MCYLIAKKANTVTQKNIGGLKKGKLEENIKIKIKNHESNAIANKNVQKSDGGERIGL